jgi:hypothetical protein
MHRTISHQGSSVTMTRPLRSCVLLCTAIVLLAASAGPASAAPDPQITSLSPSGGPIAGGTLVTITGSGFANATDVQFGGKPGTALDILNDNQLTVTSPPNTAGSVAISITSATGVIRSREPSTMYMYEELSRPRVSGVSPSSGPVTGGTVVTITGSGFTGAEKVRFGEIYAWDLRVIDDGHLMATAPASSPGTVPITVENTVGVGNSSGSAAMYRYDFPVPELTGISPASGSTAGGTVVTITGTGLSGATNVRFGGSPGTGLTVIDNSQLTVVSPPNPAGTVGLTVVNPDHTGSSSGSATVFRYDVPVPRLAGISPASGPDAGGTLVTLTGSGFNGTKEVRFGEKSGTGLNVTDDSHISIITPPHSSGSFPIAITNTLGEGGSLGPDTMFRYLNSPATTTAATKTATPAQSRPGSGDAGPVLSTVPVVPAATTETVFAPGFGAVLSLSALGALFLLQKTKP